MGMFHMERNIIIANTEFNSILFGFLDTLIKFVTVIRYNCYKIPDVYRSK